MNEKEVYIRIYREMYSYMIHKDTKELSSILDDCFVLIHMTGMQQRKSEFLEAIQHGTLNYF